MKVRDNCMGRELEFGDTKPKMVILEDEDGAGKVGGTAHKEVFAPFFSFDFMALCSGEQ